MVTFNAALRQAARHGAPACPIIRPNAAAGAGGAGCSSCYCSVMVTDCNTTPGFLSEPGSRVRIASALSSPLVTSPKIVCLFVRCGVAA